MATRHQRYAWIGEYQNYNITAATPAAANGGQAVGAFFQTTTTTSIGAPGSATITLAANGWCPLFTPGARIAIFGGTGTPEIVQITAVNPGALQITATFANTHTGTTNVATITSVFLGAIFYNQIGTSMTLVVWNGLPNATGSTKVGTIVIASGQQPNYYDSVCDNGLWIVYTGTTAGDLTITAMPGPA